MLYIFIFISETTIDVIQVNASKIINNKVINKNNIMKIST